MSVRIKGLLDLRDYIAAAGLLLVAGGVGVIYWPAALIVSGLALLYLAVGGVKRGSAS